MKATIVNFIKSIPTNKAELVLVWDKTKTNSEALVSRIAEKFNITTRRAAFVFVVSIVICGIAVFYGLYAMLSVVVPSDTVITYSNGGKVVISGEKITVTYSDGHEKTFLKNPLIDSNKLTMSLSPDAFSDECKKLFHVERNNGFHVYYDIDNYYKLPTGTCVIKKVIYNNFGQDGEPEITKFTDLDKLTEFAKSIGVN